MTEDAWTDFPSLTVRFSEQEGVAELHLSGEFDLQNAPAVERELSRTVTGCSDLVVDLTALAFMDSSAIGVLARTKQACDAHGVRLTLRLGDSPVRRVLDLVGMCEHLGVVDPMRQPRGNPSGR